jgi:hypothetical protein
MPLFQETANAARDLRILPSRALPLPRISPRPQLSASAEDKREVVVIGVSMEDDVTREVVAYISVERLARVVFS